MKLIIELQISQIIQKRCTSKQVFLTFKASLVFVQLRKMFTKSLILYYFDLKHYICIKINIFSYIIGRIPSQLITKKDLVSQVIYKTNNQLNLSIYYLKLVNGI